MTFEENLKQLQQVTEQLEQSTLPLEEALALYQKRRSIVRCLPDGIAGSRKQFSLTVEEEDFS